ncbi:MAG: SH3 domain-containing protein [Clostridia bacterium]|jgi:hypothetical protein|nr:SH3 domain-containing protein [Clostridia bacterium]
MFNKTASNESEKTDAEKNNSFYQSLILQKRTEKREIYDIISETIDTSIGTLKYGEINDLNFDGIMDNIEYTIHLRKGLSMLRVELKVNDSIIETLLSNPSTKCYIVDINTNDKYKEIILHEDGESADPLSRYYIYNGKEIIEIGSLSEYDYLPSGDTDIVKIHTADQFEPKICFGYTMLDKDHLFFYKEVDKTNFVNKKYIVKIPRYPDYTTWPIFESIKYQSISNSIGEIKHGDEVTVIDVDTKTMGITFKVRLDSGQEGWMVNLFAGN